MNYTMVVDKNYFMQRYSDTHHDKSEKLFDASLTREIMHIIITSLHGMLLDFFATFRL